MQTSLANITALVTGADRNTGEEVADLVLFLCSENAGFINGQNTRINGGAFAYV